MNSQEESYIIDYITFLLEQHSTSIQPRPAPTPTDCTPSVPVSFINMSVFIVGAKRTAFGTFGLCFLQLSF